MTEMRVYVAHLRGRSSSSVQHSVSILRLLQYVHILHIKNLPLYFQRFFFHKS
jgi:hypothetical protein